MKLRPKLRPPMLPHVSMKEAFNLLSTGECDYGPYFGHVLGFWYASLEFPEKILLLKYEEMKKDPVKHVKKLAEFLGKPFPAEEEKEGVGEEIEKLCSQVGDSKNHLTQEMIKRLDEITKEKLKGSGFTFGESKKH
ncbi:Sulfotransferase domain [Dillenia turbinata]|uniref:Sulfotransferase n=1 Tax=Dillenia turbinata TaxID=194707 RepID=A0AAN8V0E6_9MAGN